MLLPECIQDWIPEDDLAHFVIDAVAALKLDQCPASTTAAPAMPSIRRR